MKLDEKQQQLVRENIGLVGKVIRDKVNGVNQMGIYTYDDVFQIGCIGLCKAAATDKGGCFTTYAYRLIWNEICSALIYASRRVKAEIETDPQFLPSFTDQDFHFQESLTDLQELLDRAEQSTKGVVSKGIRAIRLMAKGYTCREIGEQMGANDKNVTAWVSKARKYLRGDPAIQELKYSI